MTTALYPSARDALLKGEIDLTDGHLTCAAMDSTFKVDETNTLFSDVSASSLGSVSVMSGTVASNKFTGSFPNLTNIPSGAVITGLVFYMNMGDDASKNILVAYDTSAVNLPFTATGGQIAVTFPSNLITVIS